MDDLIDGPMTILPSVPEGFNLSSLVPRSLGIAGLRMLEQALNVRFEVAPTYLFYVEISGLFVALFTELHGVGMSRRVEVVHEGGVNDNVRTLPGPVQYNNLVLRRGLTVSRELMNWFLEGIFDFKVKRLNMTIYQGAPGMNLVGMATDAMNISTGGTNSSGFGIVKQWDVVKAYPVRWEMSELNVNDTTGIVFETLELAHEGISLGTMAGTPMSMVSSVLPK